MGGEAHILCDISAPVFGKALSFLYREDDAVNECLATWRQEETAAGPSPNDLDKMFPNIGQFLADVKVKPAASGQGGGHAAKTTSTQEKWAALMKKQKLILKEAYATRGPSESPAMVTADLEVFDAARKLAIKPLQANVVEKVSAWFEKELQTGLPLSPDLHSLSDLALRKNPAFVNSFITLCAKYFPSVEQDDRITALLMELDPRSWELLCTVRSQWKIQCTQQDMTHKTIVAAHEKEVDWLQDRHKSTLGVMNESLTTAQMDLKAAQAKAERYEMFSKSLQEQLLATRASTHLLRKENKATETNAPPKKLFPTQAEVEVLKAQLKNSQDALQRATKPANQALRTQTQPSPGHGELDSLKEQLRSSQEALQQAKQSHKALKVQMQTEHRKVVDDFERLREKARETQAKAEHELQEQIDRLNGRIREMRTAIGMLVQDINNEGGCERCKCQWNMTLQSKVHDTEISLTCKQCEMQVWFYEE